jgi:hypothetical protein
MIFSGGRQQIAKVHNRLLMMISIFDILYSLALIAGPHPIPKGTLCARGAIGNELTCSIQGYTITLGAGIPSGYTATLCLYYVAVIRYNAQEATMKKFEPLMHLVSLLPGFTIATIFLINGDYHSFLGVCAISEKCRYDPDCWEESREQNGLAPIKKMFSIGLYLVLVFATITSSMIFIYCTVRERQTTMNRYNFGSLRDARGRARSGMRRLTNRVTNTAVQASLYIVSFFMSHMTTAVMVVLVQIEVAGLSPVFVYMFATFQPLQGFWNLLIFIRPKYLDARLRMRDESVMSVLKVVIFRRQQPLLRGGSRIGRSSQPLVREGSTTREIIRHITPVIQNTDITEERNKAPRDCGEGPQQSQQYRSPPQTSLSYRRASWHSTEYLDGSVASSLSLVQQPLWEGREDDEESSISDGIDNNEGKSIRTTPTSKRRGSFFSLQKSGSTVSSISEIIAGDNDLPSRSQRKRRSSLPNLYSSQNCSEVGILSLSSHSTYQNSTPLQSYLGGCLDNSLENGDGGDLETKSPPKKLRQIRKRRRRRSSLPSLHQQQRRSSPPSLHQQRRSSLPTVPSKNTPQHDTPAPLHEETHKDILCVFSDFSD